MTADHCRGTSATTAIRHLGAVVESLAKNQTAGVPASNPSSTVSPGADFRYHQHQPCLTSSCLAETHQQGYAHSGPCRRFGARLLCRRRRWRLGKPQLR